MADHESQARQLEEIYRRYRQGLFTLALSIAGCAARAEDAIQDAFERLLRTDKGQDLSVAYVFAAVRNAARDQRRRLRPADVLNESILDRRPTPQSLVQSDETADQVHQQLQELDESSREVVVLRIYSGLTFEEIGQITSEPLQTVASRYRRALLRLKERLGSCV
jgi:RNA polymerase sigma-70 factor, ECF subfamily